MSARLGTRVTAGVFGMGLLLGSVASATAALPGALFSAGQPGGVASPVASAVTPLPAPARDALSPASDLVHGGAAKAGDRVKALAAPALGPAQTVPSMASQVSDAVGPKVAPVLDHAGPAAPGTPASLPQLSPTSLPSPQALLAPVIGATPSLPIGGDGLAPIQGTLGQSRQLLGPLGPAVSALMGATPLSPTSGAGLAPLTDSVGTAVGGLPVGTGTVTKGLLGSVGGP